MPVECIAEGAARQWLQGKSVGEDQGSRSAILLQYFFFFFF